MGLVVSSSESEGKFLIDEGSYLARCCWVIDLGTQSTDYGPKRKLLIGWELPEVQRVFDESVGSEPATVSKFYTASLAEKSNLRKDLELWRGRAFTAEELAGFDLRKLLGVPCLLTITHRTNGAGEKKSGVAGLGKLPKGVECPAVHCEPRIYDLDSPDYTVYSVLPNWVQHVIAESVEYRELVGSAGADQESSIPF